MRKDIHVCLYMVTCIDNGYFYIGITRDPIRRSMQHQTGKGAAYFVKRHGFKSFRVLAWFEHRGFAKKAEKQLTANMRKKYINNTIAGAKEGHLE